MAAKIPISLDKNNRLVLTRTAAERVSRGALKLSSRARKAVYADGTEIPERIALDGTWKLNEEHDLEFGVSASSVWFPGMTIAFKTGIVKAKSDKVVFSARFTDPGTGAMAAAFTFSGRWQADKNNRLTFRVMRSSGRTDRLVFQGAWQVGKNNEIFYKHSSRKLKTKEKKDISFGLKGVWILGARHIEYKVEGSNDSVLSFSAALCTPSIRAAEGEIRYRVGIRFTSGGNERELIRSVAIHGTWRFGRRLKLGFEVARTAGNRNTITFSAEKPVLTHGTVSATLKTSDGKNFARDVKFSRKLSRDIELFFGSSVNRREKKLIGGVRGKF